MPLNNARQNRWFWQSVIAFVVLAGLLVAGSRMMGTRATIRASGKLLTHAVKRGDLRVTFIEQGGLESSDNTEIKCKVRGSNTVTWVIENGTVVNPGDELVRLDTLAIEDAINERSKYANWSRAGAESAKARLARAKLAISEYLDGRYVSQLMTLEKNLAIAESNLITVTNMLEHTEKLSEREFAHELEIEQRKIALEQAILEVDARKTDIDVLEKFTKVMELKTLEGNLASAQATYDANAERAKLDEMRRDQALEELEHCVIRAEKKGLVIYPSAAAWKSTPDVAEGATVHKDQVLLLMPDLMKMQVKVGVHESVVDRIQSGQKAFVTLPGEILEGEISSVASVARPAGWWTGNVVKYDTTIALPPARPGLKPGMSAEVEIVIAEYFDVLLVPVSAILQTNQETICWIKTQDSIQRRTIKIGDSNDVFVSVEEGLDEGDEVVLNPVAFIKEAQAEALNTINETIPKPEPETQTGMK
jgi:HlyD family secretion protein